MNFWRPLASILALFFLSMPAAGQSGYGLTVVSDGLDSPLFVTSPPGDPRLFIVEQGGRIRILSESELQADPFLDLSELTRAGGERGLLGLAFHPNYADNGRFFVNYTDQAGDTQIVAYEVSTDPDLADPASAETLLSIEQPAANHNGGWLGFGPDGYLYIATGDGGGSGDRFGNGQNRETLLGKILRIDVDGGSPYAIPPENPFAGGGGAPEIFAYGLRNPWRVAFDGDLIYVADVGQNAWEEINVIRVADGGANLGWNLMEGTEPFREGGGIPEGLVMPVHVYSHDEGCSVTGGYVYRGAMLPDLQGQYFFGDYCSGSVWSLHYQDGGVGEATNWTEAFGPVGELTSFGVDAEGELYLTSADGRLLKLVSDE